MSRNGGRQPPRRRLRRSRSCSRSAAIQSSWASCLLKPRRRIAWRTPVQSARSLRT